MGFIDTINTKLIDMLGPFGPLMAVGMLGVMLILLVLPAMMQKQDDPLDKLKQASDARSARDTPESLRNSGGTDKLDKYSNFLEPKDAEEYSAIQLKLIQAGYRTKSAVKTYHFSQFALGVAFLLLGVMYAVYKSSTG